MTQLQRIIRETQLKRIEAAIKELDALFPSDETEQSDEIANVLDRFADRTLLADMVDCDWQVCLYR